ncbi:DNA recombination protein RmuC [Galbibacter pacificus]|uniref:DNA recombination protein RmuC n=1 Tax=Galbibacter pacificus TaxID=2996052 RepID=A0ABT6FP02_9FLAO|nr:DNA recombination protein RmuC [Galbibacter pacificus]MDG3581518.1 DNA recombination protein RmuC [Galbibacter pacificus]MDG3584996.1 DNA recombination protein RmuC [Galbibacter pacificus]
MTENLILIFTAFISTILGAFLGIYIQKLKNKGNESTFQERETQLLHNITNLQNEVEKEIAAKEQLRNEKDSLAIQFSKKEVDFDNLMEKNREQKAEVEKLQEKFTKDFQILANRILEEKSEKFTLQNKENIKNILSPLQEKIQFFEKRVEDSNKESITRHSALQQQLKHLQELNLQITKEASNLTKALKGDTKMQGNWGELVLERVLEKSGLEKGSEYTVQNSFTTDEGKRVLPDVIIHLPDNKKMIVDSKVSLIAYERFVNEEDEMLKPALLKEHVNSIKKHVDQLSAKNYHELYKIESPDFVLLFIPLEPAFATASQEEPQLYNMAFEKNIVIVTPSTLLATLRTIDSMWQNDKQHKNALDIATQAGRLYDQFKNLLDDLEKVGKQLQTVQNTYSSSMTKLTGKGNLLTRVEKLKKLGAKASKQIDQKWLNRASEIDDEDELPENPQEKLL